MAVGERQRNRRKPESCPTSGKVNYPSRKRALTKLNGYVSTAGVEKQLYVYHCPDCRNWHLTSKMERRLAKLELVPNAVFREAFERSDYTPADLAKVLGWYRHGMGNKGDDTRVRRALGLKAVRGSTQTSVSYETGVALARALNLDPHEAGV